jgi:hypothetical protein
MRKRLFDMKKQIAIAAIAAIAALSSAAAIAQTAAPAAGATPVVKKHPIKKRLHKIGTVLKQKHAPAAPDTTKP